MPDNPDQVFSVDACLTGCWGWLDGRYFHATFPDFILDQNLNINLCEIPELLHLSFGVPVLANEKVV